jgi:hypothetical protein
VGALASKDIFQRWNLVLFPFYVGITLDCAELNRGNVLPAQQNIDSIAHKFANLVAFTSIVYIAP